MLARCRCAHLSTMMRGVACPHKHSDASAPCGQIASHDPSRARRFRLEQCCARTISFDGRKRIRPDALMLQELCGTQLVAYAPRSSPRSHSVQGADDVSR